MLIKVTQFTTVVIRSGVSTLRRSHSGSIYDRELLNEDENPPDD